MLATCHYSRCRSTGLCHRTGVDTANDTTVGRSPLDCTILATPRTGECWPSSSKYAVPWILLPRRNNVSVKSAAAMNPCEPKSRKVRFWLVVVSSSCWDAGIKHHYSYYTWACWLLRIVELEWILLQGRRCVLKDCCAVADNAVLPPETVVPPFTLYAGSPGNAVH